MPSEDTAAAAEAARVAEEEVARILAEEAELARIKAEEEAAAAAAAAAAEAEAARPPRWQRRLGRERPTLSLRTSATTR